MSMLETSVFYVLAMVLSLLFCWMSEYTGKKLGIVLSALVLILVSGLRADTVGIDTGWYKEGVEFFFQYGQISWQHSFALGYGIFTKTVLSFWNNYSFLLFVQALITNGLIIARLWDYREVASLTFMLLIYLCTMYLMTLCIVCQYIAIAIVFYFSRYLDKNKPVIFLVAVLLASTVHISALVGLIPLILKLFRFKGVSSLRAIIQAVFIVFIPFIGIFAIQMMSARYAGYSTNSVYSSSLGFMVFAQTFVFITALFVSGFFEKTEQSVQKPSLRQALKLQAPNSVPLYFLGLLLAASSYIVANAGRISYYFTIFGTIVFGAIAKEASRSRPCFIISFLLVIWFVAYAAYTFFISSGLGIFPYAFCWQQVL